MTTSAIRAKIDAILEAAMIGEPRSQQTVIGPSEIGSACEHCLAAKLAGWEQLPEAAWLPWLGTALHAYLANVFEPIAGWLPETRVSVGWIGSQEITGTSDLFSLEDNAVIDWKLVGATTLKKAKGGPSAQYKAQAHCYGLGFFRAGYDVETVSIYYLPRNAVSLRDGVWWDEPFDPMIALRALRRAEVLVDRIAREGDGFITDLPRDKDCWDCKRFPDWGHPVPELDTLDSLLGIAA